jgi:hypothetical protein
MSDIVERLHMLKSGAAWYCEETTATLEDAADEIERLLAERDRLREALTKIAGVMTGPTLHATDMAERMHGLARVALKETGHE